MQFSFDQFFQMIEERFGRLTANTLLTLVVLALAVLALNIIITQGIIPTSEMLSALLRGRGIPLTWPDALSLLISTAAPLVIAWIAYRMLIVPKDRAIEELMAKLETSFDSLETAIDTLAVQRDDAIAARTEALEALETANEKIVALEARLATLERSADD